jgi:hypothetical protein
VPGKGGKELSAEVVVPGRGGRPALSGEVVPGKGGSVEAAPVLAAPSTAPTAGTFGPVVPFAFFFKAILFGSTRKPSGNIARTESGIIFTVKWVEGGIVNSTNSKVDV